MLHSEFLEHARPFLARPRDADDFSDLETLRPVFANKRVVLLGEHSHGDGAVFAVKSRLVEFLHREFGFDAIAFEAGLYDCATAWRLVRDEPGDPSRALMAVRRAIPDIWSGSAQVASLLEAIVREASGARPLELLGFDCQPGGLARERLSADLRRLFDESAVCSDTEFGALEPAIAALSAEDRPPLAASPDEASRQRLVDALRRAQRALADRLSDPGARLRARMLESLRFHAANVWAPDQQEKSWRLPYMRRRELALGRLLRWWIEEHYPDRRIVVWAHQGHLLRRVNDVPAWADWQVAACTAGEAAWLVRPQEVYTIAFTTCTGWFGRVGRATPSPVPPPSQDSLEGAMLAAGHHAAFIDFTDLPPTATALRRCACRLKGHREVVIEPQAHLDGLLVVREAEPVVGVADE